MVITPEEQMEFKRTKCCSICSKPFEKCSSEKNCKVNDNCHITGKCRGAAHNKCNINYFSKRYLPIFFHNHKGYDLHLIIRDAFKHIQEIGDKEISAIPNSNEKLISFKIGDMKFIVAYACFEESLNKLVQNLYDKGSKIENTTI